MRLGCALGSLRRSDEMPPLTSVARIPRRFLCIFVRLLPPSPSTAKIERKRKRRGCARAQNNYMALWHIAQWNTIIYISMPRALYKDEHQRIVERLKEARLGTGLGQGEGAG